MSKLKLTDTTSDVFIKMSEGNPGAMTCIFEILKKEDWYQNIPGLMYILMLDDMEIYGSKLYMLWSDCCGRDLVQLELVLRNHQMGRLSTEAIKENLEQGYGTPFKDLVPLEELFVKRHV